MKLRRGIVASYFIRFPKHFKRLFIRQARKAIFYHFRESVYYIPTSYKQISEFIISARFRTDSHGDIIIVYDVFLSVARVEYL